MEGALKSAVSAGEGDLALAPLMFVLDDVDTIVEPVSPRNGPESAEVIASDIERFSWATPSRPDRRWFRPRTLDELLVWGARPELENRPLQLSLPIVAFSS